MSAAATLDDAMNQAHEIGGQAQGVWALLSRLHEDHPEIEEGLAPVSHALSAIERSARDVAAKVETVQIALAIKAPGQPR